MQTPTTRRIGAHVSAGGGPGKAVERIRAIGGTCLQIFAGSPRTWKRPSLDSIDFEGFIGKRTMWDISPLFIHSLYLVNLVSNDEEIRRKSRNSLAYDLEFNSRSRGSGVVVHLGSHQGRGWDTVRDGLIETLSEILDATPDDSCLLVENSAGQKGKLSTDFAEIRWMIDRLGTRRIGWCFDTCHAFAAGYRLGSSLVDDESAERTPGKPSAIEEIERFDLWGPLAVIHVNDSRDGFGSGRDRHANIGDGEIPDEDLRTFLTHPACSRIPLVLEVPGLDGEGPDAENIERLRAIVDP